MPNIIRLEGKNQIDYINIDHIALIERPSKESKVKMGWPDETCVIVYFIGGKSIPLDIECWLRLAERLEV